MALINIDYGSLANSETMNKNFLYLYDRISETSDSIMTSISSIYSNIATINARLSDLSDSIAETQTDLSATQTALSSGIESVNIAIKDSTMLPDWSKTVFLGNTVSSYTAPSNGYILIIPLTLGIGNVVVNGVTLEFKERENNYDNASQLVAYPVAAGDVMSCTAKLRQAYFIPAKNMNS